MTWSDIGKEPTSLWTRCSHATAKIFNKIIFVSRTESVLDTDLKNRPGRWESVLYLNICLTSSNRRWCGLHKSNISNIIYYFHTNRLYCINGSSMSWSEYSTRSCRFLSISPYVHIAHKATCCRLMIIVVHLVPRHSLLLPFYNGSSML